jgi:hypothetical protein
MKRWKITNRENGFLFQKESEELGPKQPEWGADPIVESSDITAEVTAAKEKRDAADYLASTDWLVLRAVENPIALIPAEVKAKRQQAREKLGLK